jgi:maltooligosyltrehalose trehalohydrolase
MGGTTVAGAAGRRLPVGAEPVAGGIHLRVWAPDRGRVAARIEEEEAGPPVELAPEGGGYWSGLLPGRGAGTLYSFLLDDDGRAYPDPASRFQPEGPHGPSQVVDPHAYRWRDEGWRGPPEGGQVIYEMHVGTFTPEGTWQAAAEQLAHLADLGVTVLEVMPLSEFSGRFGWGYDGVCPFAPTRLYGTPDDVRRFVDRAHGLGLAVIHDVVYNHLGPDGNYLPHFSAEYFSDRYDNEWGDALNFDGHGCGPVREYFLANAAYWIDEFRFDGLRLDATQQIHDSSPRHIVAEIAERARTAARGRRCFIVAENELQQVRQVAPQDRGGDGLDAMWNDDFHHSAMVALTGRSEAYYANHLGRPQEFISAAKYGFLYQGQYYPHQKQARGTPTFGVSPRCFVTFLQNHDQVANSAGGRRLHHLTDPGRLRAMTACLLLCPGTPMLFQGQEFLASSPFHYFADHEPELARAVAKGRTEFLSQFPSIASASKDIVADPADPATFEASKLDPEERARNAPAVALHRDLLRLRRQDRAFDPDRAGKVDGAVLGEEAFVLRFFSGSGDRLLLVNLGRDLTLEAMPEPLLAPPPGSVWALLWSSEDPRYGGIGAATPPAAGAWTLPGHAALLLAPAGDAS